MRHNVLLTICVFIFITSSIISTFSGNKGVRKLSYPLVDVIIPIETDVTQIEMCHSDGLIFITTTQSLCECIRKDLDLNFKESGIYYDSLSDNLSMQKITIVIEKKLTDEDMKYFEKPWRIMEKLHSETADQMLKKVTPLYMDYQKVYK